MRVLICLLCIILLNFCNEIYSAKSNKKYVTTLIDAKWKDTPFVLEVAEYLNDENPNYFWKFVDEVAAKSDEFEASIKPKQHYDLVMSIARNFLTPSEIALLKLGLSLRIYSARVEMFSQMAENRDASSLNCQNFVDIGGKISCSADKIDSLIQQDDWSPIDTYSIDHFFIGKQPSNKTVVLYGLIGSKGFLDFHEKLKELTETKRINYILRHYIQSRVDRRLRLSGYGVELQMKSTEYKATDDSDIKESQESEVQEDSGEGFEEVEGIQFSILKKLYPNEKGKLDKFQTYLLEDSDEIGALKVWQFQELSHQAAERIMKASPETAIEVLTDISQNFPTQAKSLIKTKVNSDMKIEIKLNQDIFSSTLSIQPSDTALFINGLFFDLDAIDVLTLLESLRTELRVMESLHKIGFGSKRMSKLLALDLSANSESQDFAIDIRDSAIIWVNDIENDYRYNRWPSSLTEMLRPTFPGMLRNVRRNLYNLVIIIDPLQEESAPLISLAESLYSHSAPLRIGFVFKTSFDMSLIGLVDPSVAVNNAFHYFAETKTPKDALQFLSRLESYITPGNIEVHDIKKAIRLKDPQADISYILGEESEYDVGRHLAKDFIKRTGFTKFPQALLNGVPLPSNQLNADSFEEAVLTAIMSQTPMFQKSVYKGEVSDSDDVIDFLMNQKNVMPRLNERVLTTEKNNWLNLIGKIPADEDYKKWSNQDMSSWLMENMNYLYIPRKKSSNQNTAVINHLYTTWVVADLSTEKGRSLVRETLDYLEYNTVSRGTIIVNYDPTSEKPYQYDINRIAIAALKSLPVNQSFAFIKSLVKEDTYNLIESGEYSIENEEVKKQLQSEDILFKVHNHYSKHVLNLIEGQRAVIFNGRVLGPFDKDEEFTNEDFSLLERFSQSTYGDKLYQYLLKSQVLEDDYEENELTDDMIMKITSLLVPRPQTRKRFDVPFNTDEFSAVKVPPKNPDDVSFNLIAVVDPVSRGAQKLGPILKVLHQSLNCDIKIFLNCIDKNSDMPLKSFYRFVMEPEPQFTADGDLVGAAAKFTKLPTSSLLTQYIHAPENWLVEVVKSVYDLDNIKLDNVAIGVHSEFELEYLLLEGHCFDALVGNPPRGLQITLGTEKKPVIVDTIVMANLGYFQLKANPGEWLLKLRQGRSADIYDITNVDGVDVIQKENDIKVLVSSLRSNVLKLKVSKKPGKANADLLSDNDEDESGIWNSISRTFSSTDEKEEQDLKINIFSLASGHLYERFLKIMMLSVIKNTKTPVKFWFLKNYLSPTLKDFLPHMAKEYGFEYELVQYKWPRWLHQQTEKQRTIWGYKILFLDVLFPLDIKKIIFVDADQVVRADLKELASMDLGGAPYAYTPFCDSRKEMEGFRFWKQGYWRNHLQGRSYHISALYVVDLKRFRRIAAGDRLRGQYQALSQDPNSLSNLDQDLPNNMIHQVAIKTLPQEWLWCETWCDDSSKKYAKTIDLCNNPMTKEAKLQAAMRILPEWTGYDEEIKTLQQKVENESRVAEKEEDHPSQEPDKKHEEL